MRQVGITEKGGSGGLGHGWGIFEFPVSCIDFQHGEKKMQLHVPSQLFQAKYGV